jgi:hypothetical protein
VRLQQQLRLVGLFFCTPARRILTCSRNDSLPGWDRCSGLLASVKAYDLVFTRFTR